MNYPVTYKTNSSSSTPPPISANSSQPKTAAQNITPYQYPANNHNSDNRNLFAIWLPTSLTLIGAIIIGLSFYFNQIVEIKSRLTKLESDQSALIGKSIDSSRQIENNSNRISSVKEDLIRLQIQNTKK